MNILEIIKDFVKENIKLMVIICIVILLIIICIPIFKNNSLDKTSPNDGIITSDNFEIVLFGDEVIEINQGDTYQEPGFYGTYNGKLVTEEVVVKENIDTNKPDTYEIIYSLGDVTKKRIVKVIEIEKEDSQELSLTLIGDKEINLYVGDTYIDDGAKATYNNQDISKNIKITNNVNTSVPGIYVVTYRLEYNNSVKEVQRTVIVLESLRSNLDISLKANTTNLTNGNVLINVTVTGDGYKYLKYPNGTVTRSLTGKYEVNQNGTYKFYAYDDKDNFKLKSITINNIDKTIPTGVCKATIYDDKTVINVNAYDASGISKYRYNTSYNSTSPNYTIARKLSEAYVEIFDKAGNTKAISCQLDDQTSKFGLEIHFITTGSDDDAILIRTSNKTIMIDGGRYEAGTKVVSYLKKIGVTKIDALIGSHVHWNHVQAQATILDNFEVANAYYSVDILNCVSKKQCESNDVKYIKAKLIEKNIDPIILKPKDFLEIGEMKLYFIGPVRGLYTTYQNANSLVFILQFLNNKFMFTGDTPEEYMTTSKFQANANVFNMNLDIDVLKWPHHGYENLKDAFFKATTPKYAIIPNCCWCSSKYPSSTNKNLMKKYGTTYYQMCNSKNIVLVSDGKNITINTNQNPDNWKK